MDKISIITPSYNQAEYLERTILSVLNQNYPNLEYIIIDGGSTDGSIDIIKKYEKKLAYWESVKDKGQYYAIQKGFSKSTGEIMAWINSDDIYHPNSFFVVEELFKEFPKVKWLTGNISFVDEEDRMVKAYSTKRWSKLKVLNGDYGWIQQESTFWKRSLWEKSGGTLNFNYSLAADFELWMRFFRSEYLYTVETLLGAFRVRKENQKTLESLDEYLKELHQIIASEILSEEDKKKINYIRYYEKYMAKIPMIRTGFFKTKYDVFCDCPPMICFDRDTYSYILKK
jgi:glycosyltransferase involved in cell wall biosynthesis